MRHKKSSRARAQKPGAIVAKEAKTQPWQSGVKTTLLHSVVGKLATANDWCQWRDYTVVDTYTTCQDEYEAIRRHVGISDLTPTPHYRVIGEGALAYLDHLVTRDLSALGVGATMMTPFCDGHGFVIDMMRVERLGEYDFEIYTTVPHNAWLIRALEGFDRVELADVTGEDAIIGLYGLGSCATLLLAGAQNAERLDPNRIAEFQIRKANVVVTRHRALGELAYTVRVPSKDALVVWRQLLRMGTPIGLRPVGQKARNVARVEAGYIEFGQDYIGAHAALYGSRPRTPIELGWEHLIDFHTPHFNGKRSLKVLRDQLPRTRLVGLDIEGDVVPNMGRVEVDGQLVGTVTSAVWSPTLKRILGLATVSPQVAELKTPVSVASPHVSELEPQTLVRSAVVCERPFYVDPARNALTGSGST